MTKRRSGRSGRKAFRHLLPRHVQSLPVSEWPAGDRERWQRAQTRMSPLDDLCYLLNYAPDSINTFAKTYGSYLAWLDSTGELYPDELPAQRITPDRVGRFILSMRERLRASTIDLTLGNLKYAARGLDFHHDWKWITRHPLAPTASEIRASRRPIAVADTAGWIEYATALLNPAPEKPEVEAALDFRNGVLVFFQVVFTLRRENLAEIKIGQHLVRRGDRYFLQFQKKEVKNQQGLDYEIPAYLVAYLETYLHRYRPVLLNGQPDHGGLWVAEDGPQLAMTGVSAVFKKIGRQIDPDVTSTHPFRHTKATSFIMRHPKYLDLASAALGHKGHSSVNSTYDRSGGLSASRLWNRLVQRKFRAYGDDDHE
ncbi:tyrosine-type recombinase/integrase [Acidocella aromatica]|uniref:Integrase n=1 Tax=Acidocella aromatica TaxID=1303579 RepID=A0A840VF11_9PROT|nr:tyrosine-type recombinase/integrase [Acidocella aromatica]MBB5374483.1 integrase [Acidocella aromatica]